MNPEQKIVENVNNLEKAKNLLNPLGATMRVSKRCEDVLKRFAEMDENKVKF